ncbi:cellulose biosynthesis cyclic di-GMP-binding regulatory protein BcsB [Neorhizobium galegae]|uniref:cellulose biosynthesis cyclic di-GMP-binding regulatory protein BcsB n=1 Tax=Neorhizobium galegae TaxID=399 RepID=UPI0006225D6F|nr:cellulose biosynthesis cyclic di-GMP-binding regulatory protein BcsB [Neorhizobium galegae]CDZ30084.1 CelB protein [Neorhizobium galegae bv. officinalis]KAA9385879.1 cellulose biosynthesis cyclic di-GMP-binding regulatory protein BcsB [Neorhizobium galegae]KAB1113694.1 cellulose biosynthesis cyclic di-GMP-binding regulatory protein BcsB [Neorhizobium galegae]MCM2496654.1 cellulose biosynthesis cyclic di-GMP-binding regulatory protein BcsB [Neorhizobium galegae]MCQ1770193.1 cellulose biosynt
MKKALAIAVLLFSAGIAPAQTPAPFNMGPERPQNTPSAAPPGQQAPAPRPVSPAPGPVETQIPLPPPRPTGQTAPPPAPARTTAPSPAPPAPAAQAATPARLPAALPAELAGRHYLVPEKSLRLNGEADQRSWSIYLTPEQAAAPAKLNLGYQNSIVVAPEVSELAVTINNVPVYANPIASPDQITDRVLDIPAGVLKGGVNLIRFRADQRHRTDCTIESTFELWTDIDPQRTFLTFGTSGTNRLSRLDDIRAVGVDEKGGTRFRLIVPALDQLGATDMLMRLTQGLALMGGMPNQSFAFEKTPSALPKPGELAIFVGTRDELRPLLPALPPAAANAAVASFLDYPGAYGASALVLSGPSWPALEGLIESFVAATDGSATQRRETLSTQAWHGLDTPFLFSNAAIDFAQLGIESQEFAGRLFRTRFTIGVPADFYANAYGEARILLDAAYTADVQPGSHIDIFVNGDIASTVPITSSGGALLRHLPIKLTLQHFKPGVNTITVEAALLTRQDIACAPGSTADSKARFALFGSSQFQMPDFARIAQVPNLAATAGTGFPYRIGTEPVSLFLGRVDEQTLSAAATFLGKMSIASHHVIPVDVTISAARVAGANALFIGSISEFPANILTQLKIDQESRNSWNPAGVSSNTSTRTSLTLQDWQQRAGNNFFSQQFRALGDWAKDNFDLSMAMLRFAPATDELYKPPQTAKLIIAQESDPTQLGTWTAIISPDSASLAEGMQAFSAREEWDRLKGRIIVYEGEGKELRDVPVSWFRFMPTQPFSPGNARLIAANWLSDNIMSYALLLAAGGVLLGLATGGLLSLLGRNR